jgi:hypothetical protein
MPWLAHSHSSRKIRRSAILAVRPLVELPDDVGADLAGGGQDPKEIPTRRWSERVSEASRILPKHRGASVSAAWPPGELSDQLLLPRSRKEGGLVEAVKEALDLVVWAGDFYPASPQSERTREVQQPIRPCISGPEWSTIRPEGGLTVPTRGG